jgi:predicted metalloprotease with PDZ domain
MQHMVARILGLLLAALVMLNTSSASAQTAAEPIRYTLRFPAPQTHYVDVEAVVPTRGQSTVELMMAVWTPGSYMVREYSRNVEAVTASTEDGLPLKIEKSDKNRWRLETVGRPAVRVTYRVYAREMTVRTNWVEADFAMLNGAPTFMTLGDGVPRPHEVTIAPAPGWRVSMTALPELPGGPHRYRALDYDTLVDSPIVVGNPTVHEFTVGGRAHYLVDVGDAGVFNGAQAARDMEAVVAECLKMWGELPYDKYVLFNILTLTEGGGGLEHKSSAMLMSSRWANWVRSTTSRKC